MVLKIPGVINDAPPDTDTSDSSGTPGNPEASKQAADPNPTDTPATGVPQNGTPQKPPADAPGSAAPDRADSPASDQSANGDGPEQAGSGAHSFDKGLQRLQQQQAAFQDQMARVVDELRQHMQQQNVPTHSGNTPAPNAQAALAEPGDDGIQEMLESLGGDEDMPSAKQVRAVIKQVLQRQPPSPPAQASGEAAGPDGRDALSRADALEARLSAMQQQLEARDQADRFFAGFIREHGYDGRGLWDQAVHEAEQAYGDASVDVRHHEARRAFDRLVADRDAAQKSNAQDQGRGQSSGSTAAATGSEPQNASPKQLPAGAQVSVPGGTGTGPRMASPRAFTAAAIARDLVPKRFAS